VGLSLVGSSSGFEAGGRKADCHLYHSVGLAGVLEALISHELRSSSVRGCKKK